MDSDHQPDAPPVFHRSRRGTTEGKTPGARMIKRYIAREIYKTLPKTIN